MAKKEEQDAAGRQDSDTTATAAEFQNEDNLEATILDDITSAAEAVGLKSHHHKKSNAVGDPDDDDSDDDQEEPTDEGDWEDLDFPTDEQFQVEVEYYFFSQLILSCLLCELSIIEIHDLRNFDSS